MRKLTKRFTKEQIKDIINLYNSGNYNCRDLSKKYDVYPSSIERLLKRNNVKIKTDISTRFQRVYHIDENYLNNIDCEEKAYFLGFFYADGYNNENRGFIKIALQEQDKDILLKFKELFQLQNNLKFINYKTKHPKWSNQYQWYITSKKLSARLVELGAWQKKSLNIVFPNTEQVPENFIKPFIRGYFDGDGSFGLYGKYKSLDLGISCSNNFAESLKYFLEQKLDIKSYLKLSPKITNIKLSGKKAIKFLDWIYIDSKIHLNRKYNLYLECKKIKCKLQN